MSKKLDDAIAAIMAASKPPGCWASHLKGDAAELTRRLREEESNGNRVNRAKARQVLGDAFDVRPSESSFAAHLVRQCKCP